MKQTNSMDVLLPIGLSFFAFLVIAITVVVFFYLTKKKVLKRDLELINFKLATQRRLVQEVLNAQEHERSRIARDLHDNFNSKLSALIISLGVIQRNSDDPKISDSCSLALECSRSLLEDSRRLSHNLIPAELDAGSFSFALEYFFQRINKGSEINFHFNFQQDRKYLDQISKDKAVHVFRIVQELVSNSIKHGDPTDINFSMFFPDDSKVQFYYSDNGKGVDLIHLTGKSTGIGIENILHRVNIIGGSIDFTSSAGEGYKVLITLPNFKNEDKASVDR